MIALTFTAENESFTPAAGEYIRIWRLEGKRIITAIERVTGLAFKEPGIKVTVHEGMSESNPVMKLRASYDEETKKATLVHELLHRLSAEYMLDLPVRDENLSLGLHKQIDLVLYDLWSELYGTVFADKQVAIESARTSNYSKAWCSLSRKTRG